jgi:hypothetical protein
MSNDSTDLSGVITLRQILASVKATLKTDDRDDQYLSQYIIEGLTELNIFHLDIFGSKPAILDISDINTVDLPSDYIDYLVIGYVVNGRLVSLTHNPNIPIPISGDCGEDTNPFPELTTEFPSSPTFGASGGYNIATYTIDKRNRRIIIQGSVPGGQIHLKYITSGISMSEETFVPRQYLPVIKAFVIWTVVENDPKEPMNNKMRKANIYGDQVRRASSLEMPSADEILELIRKGYRQSPKR